MPERYFEKIPVINYAGRKVVDITNRAALTKRVANNAYLFYPYEISEGERADQFAERYYNDSYMSWLVYLSNDLIDPYHDWHLDSNDFNEYIRKKHGSYEQALAKTAFYRNNWYDDADPIISVERFNALDVDQLKYYEPVYGTKNEISGYSRKKVDWTRDTNKIVRYVVSNGSSFSTGDLVTVNFANSSGSGEVARANSSTIDIKNVSGTTTGGTINGNSHVSAVYSSSNTVFTAATLQSRCIPEEEEIYWSAVSWYEVENERNSNNKNIRVLDNAHSMKVASALDKVFK